MNIVLWVLQVALAFYYLMGGVYQVNNYGKLSKAVAYLRALPKPFWILMGVLQALFAVAMVVPQLSPIGAACLAAQALLVCGMQLKYGSFASILWVALPGALVAFVAYGRFVLAPFS
jgi:hypothetical protein